MEITFNGKRALVTGAGRGIGKEICRKLVQCGADVVGISQTKESLAKLVEELPSVVAVQLDIGDWDFTRETVHNLGHFDILVNNAGIEYQSEFTTISEDEIQRTLDVNFKAAVNISQVVAEKMKERGSGGSIVNISSIWSYSVFPLVMSYCASKGAMDQLTRSMALELGKYQIRTNSVNPTAVYTDMLESEGEVPEIVERFEQIIPLKRICKVGDVADPVMFLLSDLARMINGVTLIIDGGQNVRD